MLVCESDEIAVVDLFCGVGGLSLGLRDSGLRIAAGVDLDEACRFPYEHNVGATFVHRDVSQLAAGDLQNLFGGASVRVLAACAPCQPFSKYTGKGRRFDQRWKLLLEVLRLATAVKPEVVTVENVPRLAQLSLWYDFVLSLRIAGYSVAWKILDSADYGVPQRRKRLVLLASRIGDIDFPPPVTKKKITVRIAIGDLPPVEAGKSNSEDPLHSARALTKINMKRIKASRPDGTWRQWPKALRAKCHVRTSGTTYPSVYGRMSWDKPSPTITTQFYGYGNGRFGHPDQDRAITLREGAILQSFPPHFCFCPSGTRVSIRALGTLIGNAVPPRLAKAIGDQIAAHAATFVALDSLKLSLSR